MCIYNYIRCVHKYRKCVYNTYVDFMTVVIFLNCLYYKSGFTTNGEFNSLRWKGNKRPLTVLQVKTEARKAYKSKGLKTLMNMLTPLGKFTHFFCCMHGVRIVHVLDCAYI